MKVSETRLLRLLKRSSSSFLVYFPWLATGSGSWDWPLVRSSPSTDEREQERDEQGEPGEPMGDKASGHDIL
jgi:hypothetical protein